MGGGSVQFPRPWGIGLRGIYPAVGSLLEVSRMFPPSDNNWASYSISQRSVILRRIDSSQQGGLASSGKIWIRILSRVRSEFGPDLIKLPLNYFIVLRKLL